MRVVDHLTPRVYLPLTHTLHPVFRREPVWKVTMSVRLRPTVRCSFDEAQGALRVTLKEPVEGARAHEEQLVIYALRVRLRSFIRVLSTRATCAWLVLTFIFRLVSQRGKAPRAEFADFARAVVESARAQEQVSV